METGEGHDESTQRASDLEIRRPTEIRSPSRPPPETVLAEISECSSWLDQSTFISKSRSDTDTTKMPSVKRKAGPSAEGSSKVWDLPDFRVKFDSFSSLRRKPPNRPHTMVKPVPRTV